MAFIRSVVKVQRVQRPVKCRPTPRTRAEAAILNGAPPAHTAACCSRCRGCHIHVSHPAPSRPVRRAQRARALRVTRRLLTNCSSSCTFTYHGIPFFDQAYRLSSYVYRHFGPELFVDSKGISSSAPHQKTGVRARPPVSATAPPLGSVLRR